MIKFKDIIKEAKWSDRKWGDPLPTLEDYMTEADDDDAFVHVGGGTYKEKNRATGKPLPNSPSYIKKDGGGFEMVDDDDPRLSKSDDDKGDDKEEPKGKGLGKGDFERDGEESDDEEGEPDFYDPEDYEKHYPEKTKPKDEVGGVKYGQGFSADSDHMFDSVADSPPPDSGLLDAVKGGDWEKFRAGIHDISDQDAREHLLNLANHVDSGTYNDEFPKGKKGLEFGRKEVMDLFRQAVDYGDEQGGGEPEDKPHGGDTGKDADFKGEPPEGAREPEDGEEGEGDLKAEYEKVQDEMEEVESYIEMAKDDLEMADDEEDRERAKDQIKQMEKERYSLKIKSSRLSKKMKGDSDKKPSGGMIGSLGHRGRMDRTGTEEIKIINGKKYRAIKEAKKPTLLYESKMEIRKMWDRIKQK